MQCLHASSFLPSHLPGQSAGTFRVVNQNLFFDNLPGFSVVHSPELERAFDARKQVSQSKNAWNDVCENMKNGKYVPILEDSVLQNC